MAETTTDDLTLPRRRQGMRGVNKKFDPIKVKQLAALGVSDPDIAKHQGVSQPSIWRFLSRSRQDYQRVKQFKENRADLLASLQGQCHDVQTRILSTLSDQVIEGLKTSEKTGLLMALNATSGTMFDKERLERGQSTSNQSIMTTMLNTAVKSLYGPPPSTQSTSRKRSKQVTQAETQAE